MIKAEILLNRALLWVMLMHMTESRPASVLYGICALLNIIDSALRMVREEHE